VEVHIRTGSQGFHDGRNRSQEQQMRFMQCEGRIHQKNPSGLLRSGHKTLIGSFQRGRMSRLSRLLATRIKASVCEAVAVVDSANTRRRGFSEI